MKIKYLFKGKLWQHTSPGGWFFVSLPKGLAKEIRETVKWQEEGWGRLKVTARIDTAEWKTSVWFDTAMDTYLLPIKAEIRKKGNLEIGSDLEIVILV